MWLSVIASLYLSLSTCPTLRSVTVNGTWTMLSHSLSRAEAQMNEMFIDSVNVQT
jgi:hypothetical protein